MVASNQVERNFFSSKADRVSTKKKKKKAKTVQFSTPHPISRPFARQFCGYLFSLKTAKIVCRLL